MKQRSNRGQKKSQALMETWDLKMHKPWEVNAGQ
jgi:hypothetical protein